MNSQIVTLENLESMRIKFVSGDYAGVLEDDRRLRGQDNWNTESGIDRGTVREQMNYFSTRAREALKK